MTEFEKALEVTQADRELIDNLRYWAAESADKKSRSHHVTMSVVMNAAADRIASLSTHKAAPVSDGVVLCEDCPPVGYPTDKTRCLPCPRRTAVSDGVVERVALAITALKPFARVVDAFDYWSPEAMPDFDYPRREVDVTLAREDRPTAIGSLEEEDFRRARTTLDKLRSAS